MCAQTYLCTDSHRHTYANMQTSTDTETHPTGRAKNMETSFCRFRCVQLLFELTSRLEGCSRGRPGANTMSHHIS